MTSSKTRLLAATARSVRPFTSTPSTASITRSPSPQSPLPSLRSSALRLRCVSLATCCSRRSARHGVLTACFSTIHSSAAVPSSSPADVQVTASEAAVSRAGSGSSRSSSSDYDERAENESSSSSSSSRSWSSWSFFSPFHRAFHWYLAQLERRPYTVQMLTSAFLFAIGDITAQHYEAYIDQHKAPSSPHPSLPPHELLHHHELHPDLSPSTPFSFHRLLACTLFGLLLMGPGGHWWYSRLDRWVAPYARPRTMRNVLLKVGLDTAVFNPVFLVVFFSTVSVMEGRSWAEIRYKLWRDFVPSYAVDCSVWPIVQCFNFRLVPVPLQLLVVNLFCYFDDVFLSYVQHNGMPAFFLWIEQAWLAYIGENGNDEDRSSARLLPPKAADSERNAQLKSASA